MRCPPAPFSGLAFAIAAQRERGRVPVSAVILKHIPDYLSVLMGFSRPVTQLWEYVRGESEPIVTRAAPGRAYRFMDLSREVAFLHGMIRLAVEDEIPRELGWLSGYDRAFRQLEAEFDIPRSDLSALIRMIHSNQGKLSGGKRKQFYYLPPAVIDRIEELVSAAFQAVDGQPGDGEPDE